MTYVFEICLLSFVKGTFYVIMGVFEGYIIPYQPAIYSIL